jgi:hypothetical protein
MIIRNSTAESLIFIQNTGENGFEANELHQSSVIKKFLTTTNDGKNYNTQIAKWAC